MLCLYPPIKKSSSELLELHSSWRFKIKVASGGSSPEADAILWWTTLPGSGIKILILLNEYEIFIPFAFLLLTFSLC